MTGRTPLLYVLCAAGLAACRSPCVDKGDRIDVTVSSTARLNDSGQGAQHVRFQVWAVRDATLFQRMSSERATDLADASNADRFPALGRAVDCGEWIKPGSSRSGSVDVAEEKQYGYVGLIALYTVGPRTALIPLSCKDGEPGYRKQKPVHSVSFSMDEGGVGPAK